MKHDTSRTPEEIESHIAVTRGRIDATLSAIQDRLTTDQLVHQGVDYLRHSGATEFAANLGGSVKHHPMPVTLVAVGLAWLMMAERSDRKVAYAPRVADEYQPDSEPGIEHTSDGDKVGSKVEQLKSKAASARHRIGDATRRLSDATHAARDQAGRIGHGARAQWGRARDRYENVMHDQPLALGAIGLGIGALIAALLPRTRREDALMGEASDRISERAQAVASEGLEDARRVATAAAEAAGEEARNVRSPTAERSAAAPVQGAATGRMEGSPPGSAYRVNESTQPAIRSSGTERAREPEFSSPAASAHTSGPAARSRSVR
jgi:hypothetical protein